VRALLLTGLLCLTAGARATPAAFIELESACPITAEALEQRVTAALLAERDPALAASITIRETDRGYEVALRTRRAGASLATKVLAAPNCEEAAQAATVVLALAFGAATPPSSTPAARAVEPAPSAAPVWPRVVVEPRVDRRSQPQPRPRAHDSLRLALSAGIDSATLPTSTAYLAAGLSRSFAKLELYGALRCGAPHVDENVSDTASERTRLDFGALELGACYGLGRDIRVSACAGSELGVVRIAQSQRLANGPAQETDLTRPRLSGVLTALLAYRSSVIEPQLELAGVVLAAESRKGSARVGPGAAERASVGLRAGLGAAVAF
jgi:hypothetical protein